MWSTRIRELALLSLAVLLMAGCAAAPAAKSTERFFWPPLPDLPRVEWLGTYTGAADFKEAGLLASILGEESEIGLISPLYLTADGNGKVYVADQGVRGVLVFDLPGRNVHVIGGPALSGHFGAPTGVALDGDGNIYVGDTFHKKITVFGKDEAIKAVFDLSKELTTIGSIAIDKTRKRIYIPDVRGHKIVVTDMGGRVVQTVGKGRGLKDGEFTYPTSAALDKEGNLVVCDSQNARIQRFTPDGTHMNTFGKRGDAVGELAVIKAAAVDSEGHVYVTDGKGNRVTIFSEKGEVLLVFGGAYSQPVGAPVAPGGFLIPQGIYIDQNDTIYIVDQMNRRFQVFQYMNEKYVREHPVEGVAPAAQQIYQK